MAEKLKYFVGINETEKKSPVKPEELTFFDPCIGSGHFAVYAFDVLMNIYVEYGYTEREATAAIVKNNIFGIDIDNRASQLAYFSIMMKARQYDRRFFSKKIQPNVYTFVESNNVTSEIISFFSNGDTELREDINKIVTIFKNSKNYGSLLNIPIVNWKRINERRKEISEEISLQKMIIEDELIPILDVAELLSRKYAVVDTNPPYLNKFNEELKNFLDEQYGNYSSDLFSAFIYRNFMYAVKDGYVGFMTPFVWMYIKSHHFTTFLDKKCRTGLSDV